MAGFIDNDDKFMMVLVMMNMLVVVLTMRMVVVVLMMPLMMVMIKKMRMRRSTQYHKISNNALYSYPNVKWEIRDFHHSTHFLAV